MNNLAKYRDLIGLSQSQLGRLAGLSQPTISSIERGRSELVALLHARMIVNGLNSTDRLSVSLDDVFPPDPPRPPKIFLAPDVGLLDKFSYGADFSFVNQEALS